MTDELSAREQEREDEHRAAVEDPNDLFQMRRKHEEKMLSVQNSSLE